jgi:hypothetical protein
MEKGIFGLGCPYADDMALRWVLQHSRDGDSSDANQSSGNSRGGGVVVFGSGMDALAAVGGLIKNNVPSRLISLVISETELEELGHQTVSTHHTHTTHRAHKWSLLFCFYFVFIFIKNLFIYFNISS